MFAQWQWLLSQCLSSAAHTPWQDPHSHTHFPPPTGVQLYIRDQGRTRMDNYRENNQMNNVGSRTIGMMDIQGICNTFLSTVTFQAYGWYRGEDKKSNY